MVYDSWIRQDNMYLSEYEYSLSSTCSPSDTIADIEVRLILIDARAMILRA